MRIAQLLPYDPEFHGGVKEHVLHLSRELQRRGHCVTIYAPSSTPTIDPAFLDFPRAVRLVVAGNFALDEPRVEHFRSLAAELGIACQFVGSPSHIEKVRLFESARLLCAPAYGQESFGIVLAEALAAGLPIVASDLAGFREVGREMARTLAWPVVAERILEVYGSARRPPVPSSLGQPAVAA